MKVVSKYSGGSLAETMAPGDSKKRDSWKGSYESRRLKDLTKRKVPWQVNERFRAALDCNVEPTKLVQKYIQLGEQLETLWKL